MSEIQEEHELYRQNILDHYKYPHNKQKLATATHTHTENNPLCGDEITIYLNLQNNMVQEVTFTGDGCAISQAAASMLTDEFKRKTLDDVKQFTPQAVYKLLGIPISHTRQKCALLALKTIKGALQ